MFTPYRHRRIRLLFVFLCFAILALLYAAILQTTSREKPPAPTGITAAAVLETLPIKPRLSREGYTRAAFSDGWKEVGGCDMRNRILQRDMEQVVLDKDLCTVVSGTLINDPYAGHTIFFIRGKTTSQAVQIDHIVAVSDAWQKGAQALEAAWREAFYNDPLNLVAVDGPANMQKGDGDAATWLPENKSYRCLYVARQVAVKHKYKLWVTNAEHAAMERVLFGCPGQLLPVLTGK